MLRKTVFVMNACLFGFLLLTSFQVSVQTDGNSNLLSASEMEICRYSPLRNSSFNLTVEKNFNGNVVCKVYTSGTKLKLYSSTDKAQCHLMEFNGTFSVSLLNLEEKHSGTYTCRIENLYPPPRKNSTVNRTLLYIREFHLPSFMETYISIGVSIFLLLCLLVALLYILISKRKHCRECDARNMELTKEHASEYMHMASVPVARYPVH
ncbi:T-cell-specific surface glycoprotein CD28-like [Eleutherodactylus coqui]|uniref:T-cell-specific surface glycoprotein CD28-like n=1 Tax=Eleutherodactylus coqui TaxID=57060 RepID=UPI0034626D84